MVYLPLFGGGGYRLSDHLAGGGGGAIMGKTPKFSIVCSLPLSLSLSLQIFVNNLKYSLESATFSQMWKHFSSIYVLKCQIQVTVVLKTNKDPGPSNSWIYIVREKYPFVHFIRSNMISFWIYSVFPFPHFLRPADTNYMLLYSTLLCKK